MCYNSTMNEREVPYYAIHKDGVIAGFFGEFSFLSNFYPCQIPSGELVFPSVENAYQSYKWPQHLRHQFVEISAGQAKKLGKIAPRFDAKKWNKKKYDLMHELNWQKYQNNPILKEKLILTEGCDLVETNSWGDMDWGCNENGEGENNLGKILMRIREKLIAMQKGTEW